MFENDRLVIERSYQNKEASSLIVQATGEARPFSAWIVDATGQVIRWTAGAEMRKATVVWPQSDWQVMEFIHDGDIPGPYTVDRDYMSSLHRKDQGYNYIVVAPRFMAMTAKELARKRSEEGFEALLVDVQDIYDEFNYGYPDCQAIKNFFRYAQSEWTGLSPEFILLIGDCTWDHRDRLGTGAKDFLPTYAPLNNPMDDASDEWYAYLWGGVNDYFSDLIIGRISVQNVEDLQKYLDKIDVYEKTGVGPWRARSVYITDDDDGTFERFAISNSQKSLPENYYPHFIHQGDYPLVTNPYLYHRFMDSTEPGSEKYRNKKYCPLCAKAIIDEFDHGSVIMQYIGHGGNQLWSDERIFYGTDKPTSNLLELQPNTRFPFVVSWSCLTGYLNFNIQPFTVCLSEELIRYPDRGAIGVWGPSGGGTTNKHMSLSKYMLRNFTLDGLDRLGEATTMTKIEFMQEETSPSLVHQYILFGDPAVRLSLPEQNVPLSVNPPYFVSESEQTFEVGAALKELDQGKAIISMTLGGEHVYESKPFEFSGGRIRHSFSAAFENVSEATAVVRFYAWNEEENRDAWGGTAIPQRRIQVELETESVVWNANEASVQFVLSNSSPFTLKDVACELRMGDQVETVSAPEIAANATAVVQWTGAVPESAVCAYASVLEDQDQGILATPEMSPLIISLRSPDNPITPLLGVVSYSGKELVEDQLVRMQIQVRNFAQEAESSASFSLAGPGAATDVKDVTLAAGQERRLDFSITLPKAGDYVYVLSNRSGDAIQTASIALTVYGKPDLALAEGDFSFEPEHPVIGHTVYLKTMVFNMGEGPAFNVILKAYDGDPSLKRELLPYSSYRSTTIERLDPGEMKEATIVWDPEGYEGLGTHEIHFVVDPQDRIEELSEDNNRSSAGLTLHDLPDLAVDRWTDHGFRTELKNNIALWGQPLDLIGKISNIGDSDADYVRFTFIHNRKDITYFYDKIPKSFREETSIEVPLYASKNTLRIVADRYDLIAEKNETDNSKDLGNNISEEARMDFDIMMPVAPVIAGRRIYRATDEDSF
ncbi:MAG: C25 family cysteine peptidase, partial [Candidatus Hinthialibacter sp.]